MRKQLIRRSKDDFLLKLASAGWTWESQRIQDYVKRISAKTGKLITLPDHLPNKALNRLCDLIDTYLEVERCIESSFYTWDSKEIKYFFRKFGDGGDTMTPNGWKELLNYLYEITMPF